MPTHPEISALIRRIADRDEAAVQEFGRKYLARFESRARRVGVAVKDCQDVAQEIYWSAVSQIQEHRLRNEDAFGKWLDAIVRGKIGDYFRAHKVERTLFVLPSSGDDDSMSLVEGIASAPVDYAVVVGVRHALERMPAELRMILLLKYSEGFTLKEISKGLGKGSSAVYRRLCEAQELFRRLLGGDDKDTESGAQTSDLNRGELQ